MKNEVAIGKFVQVNSKSIAHGVKGRVVAIEDTPNGREVGVKVPSGGVWWFNVVALEVLPKR